MRLFKALQAADNKPNAFTNKLYNLDYVNPRFYSGKKKKEIIKINQNLKQKLTTLFNNIKLPGMTGIYYTLRLIID
jgi:hypothetical protein